MFTIIRLSLFFFVYILFGVVRFLLLFTSFPMNYVNAFLCLRWSSITYMQGHNFERPSY